ncbi:MAG: Gfo/Idh/MocA family oxidoreductase [Chloroflexi bacterium]|jgi:scyllo-inositol 2-dehydrogenase (NADP+)|nr:Gfo/Idh/MocA family oxidoreductase [Chloroflexota bacterium]
MTNAEPIRLGIIGVGRAGWGMHCAELKGREDKFQIVAACDLLDDRRAKMHAAYTCATYANVEDLIADPNVEMVDIASRSVDHFRHAKMALEAGKPVNLEKPMTVSYAEAKALQELSTSTGVPLYIRHNRRFEPGFCHIREIMASGILGDVYEIKLRRVSYQRRDDWQTIKEFGGGQLLNWGPHIIDHALRLLESPVKDVWGNLKRVAAVGDAEDHIKIILTGENDRVVDLEISGGAAIREPEYLIWGSRGALSCTGNTMTLRYLDPDIPLAPRQADPGTPGTTFGAPEDLAWVEKTIDVQPSQPVDMTMIWDALYSAVREGVPYPITLDEAVSVMWVVSKVKEGTPFA